MEEPPGMVEFADKKIIAAARKPGDRALRVGLHQFVGDVEQTRFVLHHH